MIRHSARWRKDYGVNAFSTGIHHEFLMVENVTGKMYVRGYDLRGRPIVWMKPYNENTHNVEGCVRNLVYCMERAVACIERRDTAALERGEYVDDGGVGGVTGKFV